MALTPSNILPLGTLAPYFALPDVISGHTVSMQDIKGTIATVVYFICNHCPYVIHVNDTLIRVANEYTPQGVGFVAISSNDVTQYPQDSPEKMKEVATTLGYPFPYLYDESQAVARAYEAACTPDIYVFDAALKLVYHGQLDGSRPGNNIASTGEDIRAALTALLTGKPINPIQKPSMGCNIKWKV